MSPQRPIPGGYTRGITTDPYKQAAADDAPQRPLCAIACKDLLSFSRLASAARGAGYTTIQVEGPEAVRAVAQQATFILVDLQDPAGGLAAVRAATASGHDCQVYAIGPHVDTQLLQAARDAGATQVLTHNAASKQLGDMMTQAPGNPKDTEQGDSAPKTPKTATRGHA